MVNERCPRCFSRLSEEEWTDDPIITPKGEAGEDYIGFTYMKPTHLIELQDIRKQQEIDAGISEENQTDFTEINLDENLFFDIYKSHILELRESTEKILESTGQTKEEYFNYDENGKEYNIDNHQLDWKDPYLFGKKYIKAVHIEDLRHYIMEGFVENFKKTIEGIYYYFWGNQYRPSETFGLVKTQGTYLGTRYFTGLNMADFNADLTSINYPNPEGHKKTWSLSQWADPTRIHYWMSGSDAWTEDLIYNWWDTSGHWRKMDCSNSYIEFIEKENETKDVKVSTDISLGASESNMYGTMISRLIYEFDIDNKFKSRQSSKITFAISEFEKHKAWEGQDNLFFKVTVPIYYDNAEGGRNSYYKTIEITGNGDFEFPLDIPVEVLNQNVYLRHIQFEFFNYTYQYLLLNPTSGHSWIRAKIVTPIKINR